MAARNAKSAKMAKRRGQVEVRNAAMAFSDGNKSPTEFKDEYCLLGTKFAMLGCTNEQLGNAFRVSVSTIDKWLRTQPAFASAVAEGRELADANVASSLYHKAIGYKHEAVKIFATKTKTITGEGDTKEVFEESVPLLVPYTEHYAPDTEAIKFWLMNRQRDKWRNKIEVDGSLNGGTLVVDNSTNVLVDNRKTVNISAKVASTEYAKLL
jgi:hypothetical protein